MLPLWMKIALVVVLIPFAIIVSPVALMVYSCAVFVNIGRAGQWTPWRMWQIACRAVEGVWFYIPILPLFRAVVWGYITNSKDPGRLQAKKNVEYERFLEDDLAKHRKSLVAVPRGCTEDMETFRSGQMKLDVFPLMPVSGVRGASVKVRPVIVFVYGGYFDSGNKFIYNRLARQLRDHCNAVVVVPNYPIYPQGTIQEMSESIARALMWTSENAEKYGGSRDHIWVVGHSAGAYLTALTVLRSMMAKSSGTNALPSSLMAQGAHSAPIFPLTPCGYVPYVGCKTHANTHTSNSSNKRSACDGSAEPAVPNPSQPAVDYRLVPKVSGCVLLAGLYDLIEHLQFQKEIAMELTSSMTAATGGYWDATNILALCRAMKDDPTTFPLHPSMCPANGFHIVHGTDDDTCPVKQSLNLRDALLDLERVQNEAIRNGSGEGRDTPTPPQLQTPFGGSFARNPSSLSSHHVSRQSSMGETGSSHNIALDGNGSAKGSPLTANEPSSYFNNGTAPAAAALRQSSSQSVLINLCPHGVRHTESTHKGIVLDPMYMSAKEIPYKSSTIGAVFSAIYGRPMATKQQ